MKSGRKLLSIVIPAYNNPTYTRKTLKSIYAQTYRPIEIILVDDNSPKSLLKLYELFSCKSSKEIEITYIRNKSNLGPYFNLKKGISNAKGAYITIMPHDDWWIDKDFVRCAINNLESNFNCLAYISNSRIENTKNYMFENNLDLAWKLMNGEEYILKHFFSDAHPAYSGVVMNKSILDELHYLDYFMHMNNSIQSKIIPDECFLGLLMLSSIGKVVVTNRCASVRGKPSSQYSSGFEWKNNLGIGTFYQNFQFYKFLKINKRIKLSLKILSILILKNRINKIYFSYFKEFRIGSFASFIIIVNFFYSIIRKFLRQLKLCFKF